MKNSQKTLFLTMLTTVEQKSSQSQSAIFELGFNHISWSTLAKKKPSSNLSAEEDHDMHWKKLLSLLVPVSLTISGLACIRALTVYVTMHRWVLQSTIYLPYKSIFKVINVPHVEPWKGT